MKSGAKITKEEKVEDVSEGTEEGDVEKKSSSMTENRM